MARTPLAGKQEGKGAIAVPQPADSSRSANKAAGLLVSSVPSIWHAKECEVRVEPSVVILLDIVPLRFGSNNQLRGLSNTIHSLFLHLEALPIPQNNLLEDARAEDGTEIQFN